MPRQKRPATTATAEKHAYILRHDNEDGIWDRFNARAKADGYELKWLILQLIPLYIAHGLPALKATTSRS